MTGITAEGFDIDRDFAAPPAAVFAAWTTSEGFARWFGGADVTVPAATLDYQPEPGRAWSATMALPGGATIDWVGEFVEVTPDTRFVFTITDVPSSPERGTIVVELTPLPDGSTRMHMEQHVQGFSDEQKQATIAGWQTFFDVIDEIAA